MILSYIVRKAKINPMTFRSRSLITASIVFGGVFLFLGTTSADASTLFFIDSSFDKLHRNSLQATLRAEGVNVKIYLDDAYWNSLSLNSKSNVDKTIDTLAEDFDAFIYPKVTEVFGRESNPGIDGDPKITILLTEMREGVGGYFREEDGFQSSVVSNSNAREMFFIGAGFLGNIKNIDAFTAHELQHLIHHNQKNKILGVREEVWINEMMSEVASTIAGLNDIYPASNLSGRVRNFLDNPSDSITKWENEERDYSSVSMFGHYMMDHYGVNFYVNLTKSRKRGINAIEDALLTTGFNISFEEVFENWVVANLLNNCNIVPRNSFCYLNPNLSYGNLHISFSRGVDGGKSITRNDTTAAWQGNWISFSRDLELTRPSDHILVVEFSKPITRKFIVPYAVMFKNKLPQVYFLEVSGSKAKFYVEDFGFDIKEIVLMPIYEDRSIYSSLSSFSINAYLSDSAPADALISVTPDSFSGTLLEGALVRAEGFDKVYIIKGAYKRWVQAPQIIDAYGHLRWEDVLTVEAEELNKYLEVTLIQKTGDERVFWTSIKGQKRWIKTLDEFLSLGYNFGMVYEVNEEELNFYVDI